MKYLRYVGGATLLAAMAFVLAPTLVLAAHTSPGTVWVDDTCNPPATGSSADPYCTIQEGVNHANNGDIVRVRPGTYAENITVAKSVRILGAQAGNDATTRSAPLANESVVNGSFDLQVNTITLDGFIVQNNAAGAGITTSASFSGYRILNNIIRNHTRGIALNSNGSLATTVSRNSFATNNNPGFGSGNGIHSDAGLNNADVSRNRFTSHANSAITLADSATHNDVTFERNTSLNDLTGVNWYRTSDSEASRNTITGSFGGSDYEAISLGGGNTDIEISRNIIRDRTRTGIIVIDYINQDNDDIDINHNDIRTSGIHGIEVRTDAAAPGGVSISRNIARNNTGDGIRLHAGVTGNTISRNELRNNTEHDAHDDSVGTGTAGTGNTWSRNNCVTDQPDGLCAQ